MNNRTIDSYLDDFRAFYQADRLKKSVAGPDDTDAKVHTMQKILEPFSQSVSALIKVEAHGGLPARTSTTLSRRR